MTNEEYRTAFQQLKEHLYEDYAIYHERVTLLIRLTKFEIGEIGVRFNGKIIKPLDQKYADSNGLYKHMLERDYIAFSATYLFRNEDHYPLVKGSKIGRPYCPFTLWLDPELVRFVLENDDEVTQKVPDLILCNEDWRELRR